MATKIGTRVRIDDMEELFADDVKVEVWENHIIVEGSKTKIGFPITNKRFVVKKEEYTDDD